VGGVGSFAWKSRKRQGGLVLGWGQFRDATDRFGEWRHAVEGSQDERKWGRERSRDTFALLLLLMIPLSSLVRRSLCVSCKFLESSHVPQVRLTAWDYGRSEELQPCRCLWVGQIDEMLCPPVLCVPCRGDSVRLQCSVVSGSRTVGGPPVTAHKTPRSPRPI
jgi:hypothetical protein